MVSRIRVTVRLKNSKNESPGIIPGDFFVLKYSNKSRKLF